MTVIQDPPFLSLSAGDTARMSCDVKNVKVGVTLNHSWNLHGSWENLENTSRVTVTPNSLTISSVTPNDSGLYICKVRDNHLYPYTGNGTLLSVTGVGAVSVIQDPLQLTLSVGETAKMFCDVRDIEEADIHSHYWYMNGSEDFLNNSSRVTVTRNSLTISSVTYNDSGLYTCRVRDNNLNPYTGNGTRLSITEESRSAWGHLLPPGVVFVLYTALLIFIVHDLRKMKNENEKNGSERRTRRRDQVEMEMEPTYYDDCY